MRPHADLLDALDPEQRQVAEALRGPVRVLAGAGTGKTRAITHRIAHGVATGVYQPTEVLAVTFTTRAAGEMRTRLRQLGAPGVQARTFHAAALRQLRFFWPQVYGADLPTLTESKLPLLALAVRRQRLGADQGQLRDLASEVEWAKVSNVRPEEYAALAPGRGRDVSGMDAATVARVFSAYEDVKRGQGRMDMEDVLLLAAALLAEDERVAAQVRRQYKFFTVDEFQDVSPLQAALLDLWLGGRDEICVVGDPAQTIYSFAGANAAYLRDFPRKHPGTTSVDLVRNYRSTPEVVAAANTLLSGTASPGRGAALPSARPARRSAHREYDDEVAEAEGVAAEILTLRQRGRPAVPDRRAVPHQRAVRGVRGRADRPRHRLRHPRRGALLRPPGGPAGDHAAARHRPVRRGRRRPRRRRPGHAVRHGLVERGARRAGARPATAGSRCRRWSPRPRRSPQEEGADLGGFVDDLDRRATEQHAPVADGVTLATLHAAKGLEWDAVFVCGAQEGSIPISYADTPAEVEEERRLLYVGMTRAREHLSVSWAWPATPAAGRTRKPSRFLAGLLPETASSASAAPAGKTRRQGGPLPRVRQAARRRRRAQGGPLRRLPGDLRRGAVRAAQGVAAVPRDRGPGAGVRRVHRRDARGDRRAQARPPAGAAGRSAASARPSSSGTARTSWPFWANPHGMRSRNSTKYP